MFSIQGLKNSTVFTVYRKNLYSIFFCHWNDQMPCSYQSFLVCQRNILTCTDCLDRRTDPKHSHDRGNKDFRLRHCCQFQKSVHTGHYLRICILDLLCQISGCIFIPDCHELRRKFPDLLFQLRNIPSCADTKDFNIAVCAHNIQCLCSDRTC